MSPVLHGCMTSCMSCTRSATRCLHVWIIKTCCVQEALIATSMDNPPDTCTKTDLELIEGFYEAMLVCVRADDAGVSFKLYQRTLHCMLLSRDVRAKLHLSFSFLCAT